MLSSKREGKEDSWWQAGTLETKTKQQENLLENVLKQTDKGVQEKDLQNKKQ